MHTSPRRLLACIVLAALTACGGGGTGGGGGGGGGSIPNTTTVNFTFAGATPTALAVAIGAGAFTPTAGANALHVNVPNGTTTYQVAVACPPLLVMGTINQEEVYQFSVTDGTSFTLEPCYQFPTASATVTGSFDVSAIAGATQAVIAGAGYNSTLVASTTGTFSFSVPSGMNDIAVEALDASSKVLAVKIVRNVNAPGAVNGGATIALAASDALVATAATINNIPSGWGATPALNVTFDTANGTHLNLPSTSPSQYMAIASADAISSDYYQINTNEGAPGTSNLAGNTIYTSGGAATLTFPALFIYAGPTAAAWPTFALTYSGFAGLSALNYIGQISWPVSASAQNEIDVDATSAYLGSATTVVVPDLSALTGFYAHAASGTTITWLVQINGGTQQSFLLNQATGSNSFVQGRGTYVEP